MTDLTDVIRDAILNRTMQAKNYTCQYCGKSYRKESTLAAHLCEPKRRALQETERGVVLGYTAYLKFYEQSQGSAKYKTYADFCTSPYYNAFVKFGRHCVSIRAIRPDLFTLWVLRNNKRLDHWCRDEFYAEYLHHHLRTEAVADALERGMKTMTAWAEGSDSVFNHYFSYVNTNRLTRDISTGAVSSWIIFNCATGQAALDKLNTEQIEMVFPYVDPDFWKRKFSDYFADTEWVKHILREAGL